MRCEWRGRETWGCPIRMRECAGSGVKDSGPCWRAIVGCDLNLLLPFGAQSLMFESKQEEG